MTTCHRDKLEGVIRFSEQNLPVLQQWVNTQFFCVPRSRWSFALTSFVDTCVQPCLNVDLKCWSSEVGNIEKLIDWLTHRIHLSTSNIFNIFNTDFEGIHMVYMEVRNTIYREFIQLILYYVFLVDAAQIWSGHGSNEEHHKQIAQQHLGNT